MNNFYPFVNTPLPYAYNALEPYIDEKTMRLHHDRHLQTYIDNLNKLMDENPALQQFSLEELLTRWCRLPQHLQIPVRNNAGGVFNHRFYFNSMKEPAPPVRPPGSSMKCLSSSKVRRILNLSLKKLPSPYSVLVMHGWSRTADGLRSSPLPTRTHRP